MIFAYTTAFPNTPARPYLDVILRNGSYTTNNLVALVDSGADYSIFPLEVAEQIRLDLTTAPIWRFSGTTGRIQEAKLGEVSVTVLEENDLDHAFELKILCAFCEGLSFPGGALLGQNGFFSKFEITFVQSQNYFEIEPV